MTEKGNAHGFWHSVPGILTAIAAVISAAAGLVAVLRSANSAHPQEAASTTTAPVQKNEGVAEPTVEKPPITPAIYSQGTLTVRGTWTYDLDAGSQTTSGSGDADFWWEQATNTERYLAPMNGALLCLAGGRDFESLGYADIERLNCSTEKIDASDRPSNRIPVGTVVAYHTSAGRLGKLRVDKYGYDMTVSWVTFDAQ